MIGRAIIEIILLMLTGAVFAFIGVMFSKLKRIFWLPAFILGFVNVVFLIFLNRMPALFYKLPLFWFGEGRNEFLVMAMCLPFLFGILIPQLPLRRQRISVSILTTLGVFYFLVPPFLEPALLYEKFKDHETLIMDDVCYQSTEFTCGPAAAVTALRYLGIEADEGDIAIAAYSTRVWGTPASSLASALETLYEKDFIKCHVRQFETVEEMADCCPVIAIIKYRPMVDHYVTILEVGDNSVLIGDPLTGKEQLTFNELREKWRKTGITVQRHP